MSTASGRHLQKIRNQIVLDLGTQQGHNSYWDIAKGIDKVIEGILARERKNPAHVIQ
jgi:hypothetical protein